MKKEVTSTELAEILGITKRRVNQIADEGIVFQREISGNFKMVKCVQDYYANKFMEEDYKVEYSKEHALLEKAKREKEEMKVLKMKGKLHDAENVEEVLTGMLVTFKNRILGVPSKLAPQLVNQKNTNKINEILDRELRDVLTELSKYDSEKFLGDEYIEGDAIDRNENRKNSQSIQKDTEISSTTSKPNSKRMGR